MTKNQIQIDKFIQNLYNQQSSDIDKPISDEAIEVLFFIMSDKSITNEIINKININVIEELYDYLENADCDCDYDFLDNLLETSSFKDVLFDKQSSVIPKSIDMF